MPEEWVALEPADLAEGDPLEAMGGAKNASFALGETVGSLRTIAYGKQESTARYSGSPAVAFNLYKFDYNFLTDPKARPPKRQKPVSYFYTVMRNDQPRTARMLQSMDVEVDLWLAGEKIETGEVIQLEKGYYPLLVRIPLNKGLFAAAYFDGTTEEEYAAQIEQWKLDMTAYESRQGMAATVSTSMAIAERSMKRYLFAGLSERGACIEGDEYLRYAWCHGAAPYLQMLRNVTGRDFIETTGAGWVLPAWALRMQLQKEPRLAAYGTGDTDWHQTFYRSGDWVMGLGVSRNEFLPGSQWVFQKLFGSMGSGTFDIGLPHHAIYALRHVQNVKEADPDVLPLQILDKRLGLAAFRNHWQDHEDLIASIYSKNLVLHGYWNQPDAGSFRLMGLGGQWAVQGGQKKVVGRGLENIVFAENRTDWYGGPTEVTQLAPQVHIAKLDLQDTWRVFGKKDEAPPEQARDAGRGKKGYLYDIGEGGDPLVSCRPLRYLRCSRSLHPV